MSGNQEGAIFCRTKAVELEPNQRIALYGLRVAYLELGDKAMALAYLQKYRERYSPVLSDAERKDLEDLIQRCQKDD